MLIWLPLEASERTLAEKHAGDREWTELPHRPRGSVRGFQREGGMSPSPKRLGGLAASLYKMPGSNRMLALYGKPWVDIY